MTPDRQHLEQLRDQALRDLIDLDRQVSHGELTADVADRLRAEYEHAAATALAGLSQDSEAPAPATTRPPRRTRWPVYALALAVAAFAAVVLLPTYVGERIAGGSVTGNEVFGTGAPGAGPQAQAAPRDLTTVTDEEMEAVIAENPDVTGMRLALAHRYLDAADYMAAARHYLVALGQEPRNVEAQAHYGWLLLQIGQPLQAMQAVDGALAQDPQHVEASWFKANIALHGLSDPATATTVLEQLQRRTDLETAVRGQVDALLGQALQRTAGR